MVQLSPPSCRVPCFAILLLVGVAAVSAAQDQGPRPVEFTGDIGLVNTSGNTDLTTLNAGERIKINGGRVAFSQHFSVVYGRSEGEVTTSNWRSGLRADVKLSPRLGVFSLVAWDRNTFAGIGRRFEEAAGLALKVVATDLVRLEFEGGISLIQQRATFGMENDFAAGRVAGLFRYGFSKKAYVQQSVEMFPNLKDGDDFRINSESSLVAPLSANIALKFSYVVRFDNLPEPGFEKTDRLLTSGVQVTF